MTIYIHCIYINVDDDDDDVDDKVEAVISEHHTYVSS